MRKLDSWRRGAASLLAGGVFVAFAAAQSTFEDAVAKYRERIQRPSLWKRTEGRRAIAETKDSRALALLVADYAKPEPPREVVRWLCVHLALEFFRSYEHADAWTAWRTAQAKPADAWLWRAALGVEARAGSDSWIEVAESRMPAVLRAVAIAAGVESYDGLPDSETLERFAGWLRDKRTYGVDREMLVESMLAHFDRRAASLLEPEHLAMLRDIAGELGNRQCSERSKLVIARLLARITGRENIGIDPEAWRALLADEVAEAVEVDYVRRRAARVSGFFGIPDRGRHVVYVIDASDSMLAPLTAAIVTDGRLVQRASTSATPYSPSADPRRCR